MPGFVPVTVADTFTPVSPVAILPELGVVKHKVTEYAAEGGVLVEQVELGGGVEVGVGVGVDVTDGVDVAVGIDVAVGVAVGVRFGFV